MSNHVTFTAALLSVSTTPRRRVRQAEPCRQLLGMDQDAFRRLVAGGGRDARNAVQTQQPRLSGLQSQGYRATDHAAPQRSRVTGEPYTDRAAARRDGEVAGQHLSRTSYPEEKRKGKGLDLDLIRAERQRLARAQPPSASPSGDAEDELEAAFQAPSATTANIAQGNAQEAQEARGQTLRPGFRPITSATGTSVAPEEHIPLGEDGKPLYKIVNGKRLRRKRKPQPTATTTTPAGAPPMVDLSAQDAKDDPQSLAPSPALPVAPFSTTSSRSLSEMASIPRKDADATTSFPLSELAVQNPTPNLDSLLMTEAPSGSAKKRTRSPTPDTQRDTFSPPAKRPSEVDTTKEAAQGETDASVREPSREMGSRTSSSARQNQRPTKSPSVVLEPDPSSDDEDEDIFAEAGEWKGIPLSDSDSEKDQADTQVATAKRDWFGESRPAEAEEEPESALEETGGATPVGAATARQTPSPSHEEASSSPSPSSGKSTRSDAAATPGPERMRLTGLTSSAIPRSVTRAMLEEPDASPRPAARRARAHKRSRKGNDHHDDSD